MLGKRMASSLPMQHHSSHHHFIILHAIQWKRFLADTRQSNTSIISLGLGQEFSMQFFPQNIGSTSANLYVGFESSYNDVSWDPSDERHTHSLCNLLRNSRICIISGESIALTSAACMFTPSFMLLQKSCGLDLVLIPPNSRWSAQLEI